jgi:hypothetical protein
MYIASSFLFKQNMAKFWTRFSSEKVWIANQINEIIFFAFKNILA